MDVYKPLQVGRYAPTPNRWAQLWIDMPTEKVGKYWTIREVDLAVISVLSHTDPLLLFCSTVLPLLWECLFILAPIGLVWLHSALLATACTRPLPHLLYVVTSCPHCWVSIPRFYVGVPWSSLVCPWLSLPILAVQLPDATTESPCVGYFLLGTER